MGHLRACRLSAGGLPWQQRAGLQVLACTDVPAYTNATGWTRRSSSQEHYLYRSRRLHSNHLEVVILPSTGITGAFYCTEQGVFNRITLMLSLCPRYCLSDRGNLNGNCQ